MAGANNNTYRYTFKSDNIADLRKWAARLADAIKEQPVPADVDTDQQENGVEVSSRWTTIGLAPGHQFAGR